MITDRTGTIAWVNPAFSQLTGYTPQEVVGSQPRLLKSGHHEPEFYAGMWGTVLGGRVWHGEVANRRKDGSTYVEEMTITPVRSGKDEITHFVAIKQDVTARKQTEAALAQRTEELARANVELDKMRREQLELKDQFVSHVSHELRSPLAAIHQFVSILLDGLAGELTPDQKEYLQIAFRNVGQLQAMIDDLLEVLKTDAGKLVVNPESISVAKIIDEQVQAVRAEAEGKQLTITIEVAPALPLVQADPHRLRQILTNLLGNAIKFTPAGGTVLVQASVFATDRSFVCVSIADTGIGIPIAEQEQVFGRLHQLPSDIASSRRGLGLGLYICRELVKRHGGQIWVESDAGHGSTFSFTLPVQTGHEATSGPVEKS
jgi:PAS domain S-box-containing protein